MNASTNDFESSESMSAFLPLVLFGTSLVLILVFQLTIQFPQRSLLQKSVAQNDQAVLQARQVQVGLVRIAEQFNAVAPEETRAVLAKRGIQVSGGVPAMAAPAASSAPSATPSPAPSASPVAP